MCVSEKDAHPYVPAQSVRVCVYLNTHSGGLQLQTLDNDHKSYFLMNEQLCCRLPLGTFGALTKLRSPAHYPPFAQKMALGTFGPCNAQASSKKSPMEIESTKGINSAR